MICPRCLKDLKDVPEGQVPGGFYRGDEHFYQAERRFGMQCRNCGFVFECVAVVTGDAYHKKSERDDTQSDLFDADEPTPLELEITHLEQQLREKRMMRLRQLRKLRDQKIPKDFKRKEHYNE